MALSRGVRGHVLIALLTVAAITCLSLSAAIIMMARPLANTEATVTPQVMTPLNVSVSAIEVVEGKRTFWNIVVSSQGQLAFINRSTLYAESKPGSGDFLAINRRVYRATWSPDGTQLLYSQYNTPKIYDPSAVQDQRLWSAVDHSDVSLAARIPNYPDPSYEPAGPNSADGSNILLWSPDSSKILMWLIQREWRLETGEKSYDLLLAAVDLHSGMFNETTSVPSSANYTVAALNTWPTNEGYILGQYCGEVCGYSSIYTYYDYSGQTIANFGVLEDEIIFTPQMDFMIGFGRGDEGYIVNEINLSTFQVRVLWEKPPTSQRYFLPSTTEPSISPNEQFIVFYFGRYEDSYTLYIIDRDGREYGQYVNGYLMDWRPNGDLVIRERLASGEYRLVYHSLAGRRQILLTTEQFIGEGHWSPDGRFFAFNLYKELYIWQPGYAEPQLVHTATTEYDINLIAWLPDSRGLYFMPDSYSEDEIWLLTIETDK